VNALSQTTRPGDFLEKVKQTGFSRISIYTDRIDNMIGVVNILDVLSAKTPHETMQNWREK